MPLLIVLQVLGAAVAATGLYLLVGPAWTALAVGLAVLTASTAVEAARGRARRSVR